MTTEAVTEFDAGVLFTLDIPAAQMLETGEPQTLPASEGKVLWQQVIDVPSEIVDGWFTTDKQKQRTSQLAWQTRLVRYRAASMLRRRAVHRHGVARVLNMFEARCAVTLRGPSAAERPASSWTMPSSLSRRGPPCAGDRAPVGQRFRPMSIAV